MACVKKLLMVAAIVIIIVTPFIGHSKQNDLSPQFDFNIIKANKQFDTITIKLSIQNLNSEDLAVAIEKLDKLKDKATECIERSKAELKKIELLQQSVPKVEKKLKKNKYIAEKKKLYTERLAQCQLLSLRTEEAIKAFKETLDKLAVKHLTQREAPFWKSIKKGKLFAGKPIAVNNFKAVIEKANTYAISIYAALLFLSLIIGFYIRRIIRLYLTHEYKQTKMVQPFLLSLRRYIVPLLFFGLSAFMLHLYYGDVSVPLALISYAIFSFFILCMMLQFVLLPPTPSHSPLKISKKIGHAIFYRFILLGVVLILYAILELTFESRFIDIIAITIIALIIVYLGWAASRLLSYRSKAKWAVVISRASFIIFALLCITLEWVGYHQLAFYLVKGICLSILSILLFWLAYYFVHHVLHRVIDWIPNLRRSLGIKPHRTFIELIILELVAYIFLTYFLIWVFLTIWLAGPVITEMVSNIFFTGFTVSEVTISPAKITIALLTFAIINLLGRWLAMSISHRYHRHKDEDKQIAVSAIIIYITFAVALLIALLMAGVNFTGLAIIAGALSVGIGLGLQGIVNNFVSGIILLLEKPIRAGDRVKVGDVEGFIKKVRVRSTQIMTLAREDVIVPNSDLVTNQVTNYMFRDQLWRVSCKVGVAYGSDVNKIKEVLLAVAAQNSDVLQEAPNKPTVLFREFGNSSLQFELWCIIQDVNKKYVITSELNFAINKAFRENNIVIAFPQRDVHIKNDGEKK